MSTLFRQLRPIPDRHMAQDYTLRGTDTDLYDRLHVFSLFSYMQETAYHHASQLGLGALQLQDKACCWILTRVAVRLLRQPRWGSRITLKTWQRGVQRLVFLRDFLLADEHDQPLAIAASEWLIASMDTHRPIRPDRALAAELIPALQPPVFNLDCSRLSVWPAEWFEQAVISRYADFCDIDRNHHVNNTRYVAWAVDALAAFLDRNGQESDAWLGLEIRACDIQFVSEMTRGEKVDIFVRADPDAPLFYQVTAIRVYDQKPVFRARIGLAAQT